MASILENLEKLEKDILSKIGVTTIVKRPGDGFITQVGTLYQNVPTINVRAYAFDTEKEVFFILLNELHRTEIEHPSENLILFIIDEYHTCNEKIKKNINEFIDINLNRNNIHFILVDYE